MIHIYLIDNNKNLLETILTLIEREIKNGRTNKGTNIITIIFDIMD